MYLTEVQGYKKLKLKSKELILIGEIHHHAYPNKPALLVAYKEEYPQEPWVLEERLRKLAEIEYPSYKVERIEVNKGPGYNARMSMRKTLSSARSAIYSWVRSPIHLLLMPIELVVRVHYFPIWTVFDLISHVRRISAAILVPPDLPLSDLALDSITNGEELSIVETFKGTYILVSPRVSEETRQPIDIETFDSKYMCVPSGQYLDETLYPLGSPDNLNELFREPPIKKDPGYNDDGNVFDQTTMLTDGRDKAVLVYKQFETSNFASERLDRGPLFHDAL